MHACSDSSLKKILLTQNALYIHLLLNYLKTKLNGFGQKDCVSILSL